MPSKFLIPKESHSTLDDVKQVADPVKLQFFFLFGALFLAVFLGSVDIAIGGPALDQIATELGDQVLLPWFGAAYTISEGVIPIICGSLSGIFGSKAVFLVSFLLFEIGSVVCGFATSMPMMIAGRAISGLGGSAILPLACTLVSQVAPEGTSAKYIAILGGAFGLGTIMGTLFGGILTSLWSWRLCFLINVPLAIYVFGSVFVAKSTFVSLDSMKDKLLKIDYTGIILLLGFSLSFDVPLQLGGTTWAWNSAKVIGMFSMSAVFLVAFAVFQLKVANTPLIPQNVLLNKQVVTFAIISFMSSAVLYVITYFSPFYVEFVYDMAPMNTSLIGLSFTLTCVTASMFSGYYFSRTGRFDVFFVVGPVFYALSMVAMAQLTKEIGILYFGLASALAGVGLGLFLQLRFSALHSVIDRDLIATSTGFISAAMGMGGNIAIVVMGTIINNFIGPYAAGYSELQESIATLNSMGIHASVSDFSSLKKTLLTIASVNATTQPLFEKSAIQITEAFHSAVNIGFYALIPYMVVILCLTPLIWQKKRSENDRKLVKSNLESS